jgi:PAS domain S-box-containing protein
MSGESMSEDDANRRPSPIDLDGYRLLVESVRDYAIFLLDVDGHVLTWNPGAERLKGYTAEDIIGRHFSTFYPQEEIDAGKCEYELVRAAEVGRFEDEGWRLRKDGSRMWANVVITALRDESGTLCGYGKVTRDLTERKAAEEQLRESEERLRLLVEEVKDYAIFMLDPDGRVMSWNAGAQRLKQYRAQEIIGKHFSTFYSEEDKRAGKPEHELRVAIRDGRVEDEGWRLRKDGSRFLANVVITALRDGEGTLRGFAKVTRDVTERFTTAERALQKSEARFRALADNIAQLAWMADETGSIFWYNRRWFEFSGTTPDQMHGWGWKTLHHPEHLERVVESWTRALASKTPWEDTFPLRSKDGQYHWFLTRALPVNDDAGKVLLWFGTNTDVTEQRKLEEALKSAVHARDVFLGIASHELKTPLTPLTLQLQSIERMSEKAGAGVPLPADKVMEKVVRATLQVAHLDRLVNNLLDVSRLSEDRLTMNLEQVDLAGLVSEIAERLRPEVDALGSGVTITTPGPIVGAFDRFRLDQVFSNLLTNALKYGRGKPVEVEVSRHGSEALVSVRDRGIGISPEDHDRIFGRFERAVSANNYGGFGLGLWISRELVEAMRGRIRVESALGQGSTFTVVLPMSNLVEAR